MPPKPLPSSKSLPGFARAVLFGTTLEEKLAHPPDLEDPALGTPHPRLEEGEVPAFPGRPPRLSRIGRSAFPSVRELSNPRRRGEVLHFFANHELLALELMALALLRFPEAPESFRRGLLRTLLEEQSHLRLYLSRMQELGIGFGELPLSDYFWKSLSGMRSPLDFVVQMSLTLEQANLDYSLFYRNEMEAVGDHSTAAILERVFREEIGHVRHGVAWFNRWRQGHDPHRPESDWEAYRRLLPPPMTPQRAKGLGLRPSLAPDSRGLFQDRARDARLEAGLSPLFVSELERHSGSRGRPPVLWWFDPLCEARNAPVSGAGGAFSPKLGAQNLIRDLAALPIFLAASSDLVLVPEMPDSQWLGELWNAGFPVPELITSLDALERGRTPKLAGLEPWGWSEAAFESVRRFEPRLVDVPGANASWCRRLLSSAKFDETGLRSLFSKSWSAAFLSDWLAAHPETHSLFSDQAATGTSARQPEEARARIDELLLMGRAVALKAPYGTAGTQVRRIERPDELNGPLGGWVHRVIRAQGAILVEPWLEKRADLSMQIRIAADRVDCLEVRRFLVGARNEYRGTLLGSRISDRTRSGFAEDELRLLNRALPHWRAVARDLGDRLREAGYQGPAGIDALIHENARGELRLKPLVECNPRWTMGRVALALEEKLAPGVPGAWLWLRPREIERREGCSVADWAKRIRERFPIRGASSKIGSGVIFTTDPGRARAVVTLLAAGPEALQNLLTI